MIYPVQVWFDGGSLVRIGQKKHTSDLHHYVHNTYTSPEHIK
jgi:hypothetical protein